jgi:hypothetical protein
MLRSALAVLAGYLTMVVAVTGALGFLFLVFHDVFPQTPGPYTGPTYVLVLELVVALLAAICGGYVCALVARQRPLHHAAALGGLMLALGVVSIIGEAGMKPMWSTLSIVLASPLAAMSGAWLRGRHGR